MTNSERQARLDGQLAAIQKRPFTGNPHPLGCSESRAWSKGWNEIDAGRAHRKARA